MPDYSLGVWIGIVLGILWIIGEALWSDRPKYTTIHWGLWSDTYERRRRRHKR